MTAGTPEPVSGPPPVAFDVAVPPGETGGTCSCGRATWLRFEAPRRAEDGTLVIGVHRLVHADDGSATCEGHREFGVELLAAIVRDRQLAALGVPPVERLPPLGTSWLAIP